jgi:hypothetical protein
VETDSVEVAVVVGRVAASSTSSSTPPHPPSLFAIKTGMAAIATIAGGIAGHAPSTPPFARWAGPSCDGARPLLLTVASGACSIEASILVVASLCHAVN